MKRCFILITIVLSLVACGKKIVPPNKTTITVSAAVSLKAPLESIKKEYERTHENVEIKFNFGASGTLAEQINNGAPVDLFFSAAEDKVAYLKDNNHILHSDTVLHNNLVIASNIPLQNIDDLKNNKFKKVAIGTPSIVPAGKYAKEALTHKLLFSAIERKIIYTKDVRQALTYVETGNVDASIVYKSDVHHNNIKFIVPIKSDTHTPIVYPLAMIKNSKHHKETASLYDYLQSKESLKIYESYGFDTK